MAIAERAQYTVLLMPPEEPDQAWGVLVPALPGCVSQGATREEALEMIRDAIRLHVESLRADGLDVPIEREHPQAQTVIIDT